MCGRSCEPSVPTTLQGRGVLHTPVFQSPVPRLCTGLLSSDDALLCDFCLSTVCFSLCERAHFPLFSCQKMCVFVRADFLMFSHPPKVCRKRLPCGATQLNQPCTYHHAGALPTKSLVVPPFKHCRGEHGFAPPTSMRTSLMRWVCTRITSTQRVRTEKNDIEATARLASCQPLAPWFSLSQSLPCTEMCRVLERGVCPSLLGTCFSTKPHFGEDERVQTPCIKFVLCRCFLKFRALNKHCIMKKLCVRSIVYTTQYFDHIRALEFHPSPIADTSASNLPEAQGDGRARLLH